MGGRKVTPEDVVAYAAEALERKEEERRRRDPPLRPCRPEARLRRVGPAPPGIQKRAAHFRGSSSRESARYFFENDEPTALFKRRPLQTVVTVLAD